MILLCHKLIRKVFHSCKPSTQIQFEVTAPCLFLNKRFLQNQICFQPILTYFKYTTPLYKKQAEDRGIEPLYVLPPFCFQDSAITNSGNLPFAENKGIEPSPLFTRNILAGCRSKPMSAYSPFVGQERIERSHLRFTVVVSCPDHYPACTDRQTRTVIHKILSFAAFPN